MTGFFHRSFSGAILPPHDLDHNPFNLMSQNEGLIVCDSLGDIGSRLTSLAGLEGSGDVPPGIVQPEEPGHLFLHLMNVPEQIPLICLGVERRMGRLLAELEGGRSMGKRVGLCILLTLVILHVGTFVGYGVFALATGLEPPEDVSPGTFLLVVLIDKTGHAIAFVLIFFLARNSLTGRWPVYAFVWWLMFVLGEVARAIGPGYSRQEAIAGMLSETIYFPISAYVTNRMLRVK